MTTVIVLCLLAAYLFAGFRYAAPRFITRQVQNYIKRWPLLTSDHQLEDERQFWAGMAIPVALVWPFYFAGIALTGAIGSRAPLTPLEQERKISEQQRYIEQLERETGIRK